MGQTRVAAATARLALLKCLPVRRDLPGARHRRRAGAAASRHRGPATASERDIPSRRCGRQAVLLMDRAGWHTTANLDMPKNITPILLPSRAPELNPVENIWQYMRANWLSNRVFETYDAIVETACEAWRKLIAQPDAITSIGMREWAHVGQSQ